MDFSSLFYLLWFGEIYNFCVHFDILEGKPLFFCQLIGRYTFIISTIHIPQILTFTKIICPLMNWYILLFTKFCWEADWATADGPGSLELPL